MKKESQQSIKRSSNCCTCFKTFLSLLLTVICLVPVIFIAGTEQSFYYDKPFYSLLEQNQQLKDIKKQIDSRLSKSNNQISVINLYSSDASALKNQNYMAKEETRRWQNLKQSAQYLGYWLNTHNRPTISRFIKYPSENISSLAKEALKDTTKKVYNFDIPSNPILYLKKKLAKMIKNMTTRLGWKEQIKPEVFAFIKNYIISLAKNENSKKIWLVVLSEENQEYHHPSTLNKKMEQWRELHKNDELIIVSRLPIDSHNSKIASIEVNIQKESLLNQLQNMDEKKEKLLKFPVPVINPRNIFKYLLKKHEGSLSKISKFVQYCHQSVVCKGTYTLLRKYIDLKYNIEGKLDILCKIDQNYVNALNQKELQNDFGQMMVELAVTDKKQFKKDLHILHNIIRSDFCGDQPTVENTNSENEAKVEEEIKVKEQSRKEKKEKNVEKGQKNKKEKEILDDRVKEQKKVKFEEKVKKAKLMQEEKLKEAEKREKRPSDEVTHEQQAKVNDKKSESPEKEETTPEAIQENNKELPLQEKSNTEQLQVKEKQTSESAVVDIPLEEITPEDHSIIKQEMVEEKCNKKDGQTCLDADQLEESMSQLIPKEETGIEGQ